MAFVAATIVAILSLAYTLGLLATSIPGRVLGIAVGGWILLLLGVIAALWLPRYWRTGVKRGVYLVAGGVGLVACLYLQWRIPQPASTDISRTLSTQPDDRPAIVLVDGNVTSTPRLTRSGKRQFWLDATQVSEVKGRDVLSGQTVTGKVYVTVPAKVLRAVHPGQKVSIRGVLYQPKPATNPGGFDFQTYLQNQGCFAGLRGWQVEQDDRPSTSWGWWMVRQRIINAQARWLGEPEGSLVSAMVIGSRAIDLPYDVKDAFVRTGLAHALAASGFQVSLILSVVIALTQRFSPQVQFSSGMIALGTFVGLTGIQPAVMRAAVMGAGALIGLVMERQIKPLGSLLLASTLLLLWQPLWVWDLGFQLSLLATLGLLVTAPLLTKWLDWLPTTIAPFVAVPIAAYLWTLPLQLFAFGVVSPYSIPVNLVATPLISIISLGGFISALVSLLVPIAGSALAWMLYFPSHWLIQIVQVVAQLPGNGIATGRIALWQLLLLYGLLGLVWWQSSRWQQAKLEKRSQPFQIPLLPLSSVALVVGISLVIAPAWYTATNLVRATVMATPGESLLVWQERGKVGVIGDLSQKTAELTLLPFLQAQGVNRLDWAVALDSATPDSGWLAVLERLPIATLHHLPTTTPASPAFSKALAVQQQGTLQSLTPTSPATLGSLAVRSLATTPPTFTWQTGQTTWLWLRTLPHEAQVQLVNSGKLSTAQVVWWTGDSLSGALLKAVQPKWAIATAPKLKPDTLDRLRKRQIQLIWTAQDGAVQWTPTDGFVTDSPDTDNSL